MISFPNAKINLGLHVVEKRPDGFHNLETIFYPVDRSDILEIMVLDEPTDVLELSGLPLPGDPGDNLCLKAGALFRKRWREKHSGAASAPFFRMHLHKAIPAGSGLGGGSSDAAHALRMMNRLLHDPFSLEDLVEMASLLGSDCPFFLLNRPMLATGRGDCFRNIALDLSGYHIELVFPGIHVSTAEAFSMIAPAAPAVDLSALAAIPVDQWMYLLKNDFETPMILRYPEIGQARDRLYEQGALYASMTGSGSAVYGIFLKVGRESRKP